MMDFIAQSKEIMEMLVLQNKEQAVLIKEQNKIIKELVLKIGSNNTINTNYPRETTISKVTENITQNTGIIEK
jgi:hypothetical protein